MNANDEVQEINDVIEEREIIEDLGGSDDGDVIDEPQSKSRRKDVPHSGWG